MVMPIADDNSDRRIVPLMNYLLIAINVWVFLFFEQAATNEKFIYAYSAVPKEIVTGQDIETPPKHVRDPRTNQQIEIPGLQPTPVSVYLTLLTSMFMHGGWAHILGNMLFLWIFGDNVEDVLGHGRYIAFYLLCGLIASLAHVFSTVMFFGVDSKESVVPSLGASGAISGVMGGYLFLHPHRRVTVIMFRFLTTVPAYVAVGMWFGLQLIMGLGEFGKGGGGVAYMAHIGGFVAGLVLVIVFAPRQETRPITAPAHRPMDEPW